MKKTYIQWFNSEADAWKFCVTWCKLTKWNEEKHLAIRPDWYQGEWWAVLVERNK